MWCLSQAHPGKIPLSDEIPEADRGGALTQPSWKTCICMKKNRWGVQEVLNTQVIQFTNRLLQSGDFFICGNERQRDFWLGMLAANGRLTPHTSERTQPCAF